MASPDPDQRLSDQTAVPREIRDNQREALQLQRKHASLVKRQLERADTINQRADALQGRAGHALTFIAWIGAPLLAVLLVLMLWPYLRAMGQ